MALLSVAKRKEYMKFLGYSYSKSGIKRFQKVAFPNLPKEWDGIWGSKTDTAARHWRNVRKFAPSFQPQEFRCPCGNCTGYPTRMKTKELKNLQAVRNYFKKPITVTSGLRCKAWNSRLSGSSSQSRHLSGYAVDIYIKGVTDTLKGRKKVIKYARKLRNAHYAYCNGYNSYGNYVNAPNMGNAVHIDTK